MLFSQVPLLLFGFLVEIFGAIFTLLSARQGWSRATAITTQAARQLAFSAQRIWHESWPAFYAELSAALDTATTPQPAIASLATLRRSLRGFASVSFCESQPVAEELPLHRFRSILRAILPGRKCPPMGGQLQWQISRRCIRVPGERLFHPSLNAPALRCFRRNTARIPS
jgi:hypothetical protein